jgi:hypothetical protein
MVISILDTDSTITAHLMRQPPSLFGRTVRTEKYESHPFLQQCDRCWDLGHSSDRCRKSPKAIICPICDGPHCLHKHPLNCKFLDKYKDQATCDCELHCLNCRHRRKKAAGHSALDVSCPLREDYRIYPTDSGEDGPPAPPRARPQTARTNPIPTSFISAKVQQLATRPTPPDAQELEALTTDEQRWLTFKRTLDLSVPNA